MIKRTIEQIKKMIHLEKMLNVSDDTVIHGVSIDSRNINKGNLFIPLKGEKVDGHQFVEQAIKRGARCALWQKNIPHPPQNVPLLFVEDTLVALQQLAKSYRDELNIPILGVTGSNGKTTTKDMVASLISTSYKVQKTEGNFNNHIGLPLTLLNLREDTEMAVVEMGMSGLGEISFLTKLARPDVAIITNIGEAHLLDLGSREKIAEAKLEILDGLKEGGLFIFNGDEPLLKKRVQGKSFPFTLQTFGKGEENTIFPLSIKQVENGSVFTINDGKEEFHLPILGVHNVMNALAAILAARHFGISYEKMQEGFKRLQITNMRMELVKGASGETIINDAYNASPTSMKAALELMTSLTQYKKKIVVLGDMLELGDQEIEFHKNIGLFIDGTAIDYVFTYGRLGAFISEGAKEHIPEERIFHFDDKEKLAAHLKNYVDQETVVLVKSSRGIKLETVVQALQK